MKKENKKTIETHPAVGCKFSTPPSELDLEIQKFNAYMDEYDPKSLIGALAIIDNLRSTGGRK